MEPLHQYIARFSNNRDMRDLFHSLGQRAMMAELTFRVRWKTAEVTVRKADGEEFFIE